MKSRILLGLLLLTSCSLFSGPKPIVHKELLANMNSTWFSLNSSHSLWDRDGKPQTHGFFDVGAEFSNNMVNVVIVTPESSSHAYEFDLPSGRRYFTHSYCPQRDVWNKVSSSVWKPNYTTAVIPGYMDQLADPQKVLIFSSRGFYEHTREDHYHRVKIIGAYFHQTCADGNCLGKSNWLSRLVFLAVDPDDPNYASIETPEQLQDKIDWTQTLANIENIDGRNGTKSANFPAFRVGAVFNAQTAVEYHNKFSMTLQKEEIKKIQKSCFNVYEKLWEEVGKELIEDKAASTTEELKAKAKLRAELIKQKKPVGFSARLRTFTRKYYPEVNTCSKYVYPGNVNQDPEKFWFLAQFGIFFRLHQDGYYFDCNLKSWQKNYTQSNGEMFHILKRDIALCSDKELDAAMNFLPNFLTGLKGSGGSYYRFVEYDGHGFGTHDKVYSWVKTRGRTFDCAYDPNEEIRQMLQVYPEDIVWRPRDVKDDGKEKVIY